MDRPKRMWSKKVLKLKENHGWESRPGYSIFVADRGSVRFDFPRTWIIEPTETGSIRFHDRKPPKDDCTLEMTVMYLNDEVDWSQLPLAPLTEQLSAAGHRLMVIAPGHGSLRHAGSPVVRVRSVPLPL